MGSLLHRACRPEATVPSLLRHGYQAASMVGEWLLSPDRFCVAPAGDFAGNADECYWGLPSIQRGDPAFPPLGYWRGYVWGPMAQLVYWALQARERVRT